MTGYFGTWLTRKDQGVIFYAMPGAGEVVLL